MKHFFFYIAIVFLAISSCKKEKKKLYMSTATIAGRNYTVGQCHGPYYIRIDNPNTHYTFDTLPRYSGINLNIVTASNPIRVQLNWHHSTGCEKIIVDDIEQIK